MLASSALLWGLFVPLLDGDTGLPESVCIQVRMLFLKPGMDRDGVHAALRLGRWRLVDGFANLRSSFFDYRIADDHRLTLEYRYDFNCGKSLLHAAELTRGQKTVMRVSAPKTVERNDGKGIDPKLIEEAIRAIQDRKIPAGKKKD